MEKLDQRPSPLSLMNLGRKIIIIDIALWGNCNFNCDMCAYEFFNKMPHLSESDILLTLALLDRFLTSDTDSDTIYIICFMGGELTTDLVQFNKYYRLFSDLRSKHSHKVLLALSTNGTYGDSPMLIKALDDFELNIVQLSCSKDHAAQGNKEWVNRILSQSLSNNWVSFIGDDLQEIKELYGLQDFPEEYTMGYHIRGRQFGLTELHHALDGYDLAHSTLHGVSSWSLEQDKLGVKGIFITSQGLYPVCPGEGLSNCCRLGDLIDLPSLLRSLIINTFSSEVMYVQDSLKDLLPLCAYCKIFDETFSCMHNPVVRLYKQNGEIKMDSFTEGSTVTLS